jgi:hypothetical protein
MSTPLVAGHTEANTSDHVVSGDNRWIGRQCVGGYHSAGADSANVAPAYTLRSLANLSHDHRTPGIAGAPLCESRRTRFSRST